MSLLLKRMAPPGETALDASAAAYIAAVEAADGQRLERMARAAINQFVIGCKADGTWSALQEACILAGARTLAGMNVPLVGSAPQRYNFVSGDYNRKTGLASQGSSSTPKYLRCNRLHNSDPQNDRHFLVYLGDVPSTQLAVVAGCSASIVSELILLASPSQGYQVKSSNAANSEVNVLTPYKVGAFGVSRSNASVLQYLVGGGAISGTYSMVSAVPGADVINIFRRPQNDFNFSGRLSFYSIGTSINLGLMSARLDTLMAGLAAAIP